jgi:hypothetical protein
MNKKLLMMAFVSLLAAATFSSCDKDKDDDSATGAISDGVLTGAVEGLGDTKPDSRVAEMYYELETSSGYVVVGRATLADGKLTLRLNTTVDDKYLSTLSDAFEISPDVKVSNKNVKIGDCERLNAYKSGKRIGIFYYGTGVEEGDWGGFLMYVNDDVSITGTETNGSYNLHLRKGWNIMYLKETRDDAKNEEYGELTTTAPSGAKWWYIEL